MTRKEKVLKACELLKEGQKLLKEAGFRLLFDSYNDNGVFAIPEEVSFEDDLEQEDNPLYADDFLSDCPVVLEAEGFYNEGRIVESVPDWWKGWKKFLKEEGDNHG